MSQRPTFHLSVPPLVVKASNDCRIGHVCAIYFDMIAISGWQLKIVMSSFIPLPNEGWVLVENRGMPYLI